jgi:heavy metal translocating P-type ATPase
VTAREGGCDLCGLPVPTERIAADYPDRRYRFCCIGCRQVFAMLMEAADAPDPARFRETDLFRNCQELGIIPRTADEIPSPPPDRPLQNSAPAPDTTPPAPAEHQEETLSLQLRIDGMWCPACAWVIETVLKQQPGVREAACQFSTDRITCRYSPLRTNPGTLTAVIGRLGYSAVLPGESRSEAERKRTFVRFGVCAFLTMNVMMLSFGLYSGFFAMLGPETIRNLSWPLFVMASIVLFYGGYPIYRRALSGITAAAFGMETLITLGAFSAYLYSVFNLLSGSIHLYFDTVSMLITLVLLGKAVEGRAKGEIREGLEAILSLRPTKVRICTRDFPRGRYTAAEGLRKGDRFRISEGETVPADGVVQSGSLLADESSLTGEARPVRRQPGDRIRSGALALQGDATVRADAVGREATLGQMLDIIEQALATRTRIEGKTDRILRWFVPLIVSLAAATALGCLWSGLPPDAAMVRAVTVMVISCPCALGIAIPLTRVAGISLAGRHGLLVRDFSAFESADRIDALVFDKTGTLTRGRWRLAGIQAAEPMNRKRALALAAGLEAGSEHPVGAALREAAREEGIRPLPVTGLRRFDNGIYGKWEGAAVRIGSAAFVLEAVGSRPAMPDPHPETDPDLFSTVLMGLDDRLVAVFRFGDDLRPEAPAVLQAMKKRGVRTAIVSGDGQAATDAVARALRVGEARGDLLPHDKAAFVRSLKGGGRRTAMVGDGVNDAPALAASDLAVAVHSGSHLGREAADLILMRGDLTQIIDFLDLAVRVRGKIRQNLAFTFFYNAVAIPVAMAGLLTPLVAVCAMLMSSLSVLGNTLHLTASAKISQHRVAKPPNG